MTISPESNLIGCDVILNESSVHIHSGGLIFLLHATCGGVGDNISLTRFYLIVIESKSSTHCSCKNSMALITQNYRSSVGRTSEGKKKIKKED